MPAEVTIILGAVLYIAAMWSGAFLTVRQAVKKVNNGVWFWSWFGAYLVTMITLIPVLLFVGYTVSE